jgi:C-terminal processing protease CtpA/Prc
MPRSLLILALIPLLHGRAAEPPLKPRPVDADLAAVLGFERPGSADVPEGWRADPNDAVMTDHAVKHSGDAAAQLSRAPGSPGAFSSLRSGIQVSFRGTTVELRGYLRTASVTEAAGLWMREDGELPSLQFVDMSRSPVKGTTGWQPYSIKLPLNPDATRLFFGVTLEGTGTVWADDLMVLVDGQAVWNAPVSDRPQTVLDQDREFVDGSKIAATTLSAAQVNHLAELAKVWGFLKYHHPAVTSGTRHWDFELFRIMPAVLAAKDDPTVNALFVDWIDRLGPVKPHPATPVSGDVAVAADDGWLADEHRLGAALSTRLRSIRDAHASDDHPQFYVSLTRIGHPQFTHEPAYQDIALPDAGFQLLGLFRVWNVVQYWAPYRPLVEGNWDAILREFIPRVALAKTSEEYQLALMAMFTRVSDTHANLWSSLLVRPPTGQGMIPAIFRFIEGVPTVTSVVSLAGEPAPELRRGDVVLSIDGQDIRELVREWAPYYAASNEPARLRNIAAFMGRGPLGEVALRVRRLGQEVTVHEHRAPVAKLATAMVADHGRPGDAFQRLSPDVAYLKVSTAAEGDVPRYLEQAEGTKGWIVDLRGYPHGSFHTTLGRHFLDATRPYVCATTGNLAHPGTFMFQMPATIMPKAPRYRGKVIVLVDEATQSAAEFQAMGFRAAPGVMIVGSTTAGADGNVSRFPVPGGFFGMLSGLGVYYPDHRPTQRVGIVPDIEAQPTVAGMAAGRDEVLEAALRVILGPGVTGEELQSMSTTPDTP